MKRGIPLLPLCCTLAITVHCASISTDAQPLETPASQTIVACVGDSITFGLSLPDRNTQSYPAVLQQLAGSKWKMENFGVSGATALPVAGYSWLETPAAQKALKSMPNIVIIMLGINDLKFYEQYNQYNQALRQMVELFQQLPTRPSIFVCTLTPIAPVQTRKRENRTIQQIINPQILDVAKQTGARVIDVSSTFPGTMEFLPDGVHPSPQGAELIAKIVWNSIQYMSLGTSKQIE